MPALDVPPPPAPAPQGQAPRAEAAPERVFWAIYKAPPRAKARYLVVRWRVVAGLHRSVCDEPIAAGSIKAARALVPRGLKKTPNKFRGRGTDRLVETWSEEEP